MRTDVDVRSDLLSDGVLRSTDECRFTFLFCKRNVVAFYRRSLVLLHQSAIAVLLIYVKKLQVYNIVYEPQWHNKNCKNDTSKTANIILPQTNSPGAGITSVCKSAYRGNDFRISFGTYLGVKKTWVFFPTPQTFLWWRHTKWRPALFGDITPRHTTEHYWRTQRNFLTRDS